MGGKGLGRPAGPERRGRVCQESPAGCAAAASPEDGASHSFCISLVVLTVKSTNPSCIAMVVTSND